MNSPILQDAKHTPASRMLRLFPFALVLVIGCGESTTGEPTTNAVADAYLSDLPPWDEFSPERAAFDDAIGDPRDPETEDVENPDDPDTPLMYNCVSTPYSITSTPDEIVTFNPDSDVLWVGSLLQGSGYAGGLGSLQELPIRERTPVAISIDLLSENNTRTVDDPSLASVGQAIGSLIETASDAGHRAGSKISYNQVTSHSVEQAMLKAGFSASYSGVGITSSLEASRKATESTVLATYTQQMFTVSMVLPQTPGAVFSDAFTEEVLQEQVELNRMGPNNLPVFVSSIVYGQTLVFSVTAKATAEEIKAALMVGVQGVAGVDAQAAAAKFLSESEVKLVTVGGDAANAAEVIKSADIASYFNEDSALTTARPLSYTIRNLADNVLAKVSTTTKYDIRTCTAPLVDPTGGTYELRFSKATVIALPNIDGTCPTCSKEIDLEMTINVSSDGPTQTVYEHKWKSGEVGLAVGASFPITMGNNDLQKAPKTDPPVTIHFDGRDRIQVFGEVRDNDNTGTDKLPIIAKNFHYPEEPMPASGTELFVDGLDTTGNRVRIFYTVTKIQDLDD